MDNLDYIEVKLFWSSNMTIQGVKGDLQNGWVSVIYMSNKKSYPEYVKQNCKSIRKEYISIEKWTKGMYNHFKRGTSKWPINL